MLLPGNEKSHRKTLNHFYAIFYNNRLKIFRLPLVTKWGFNTVGRQLHFTTDDRNFWMPHLGDDGLSVIDQFLGYLISRFIEILEFLLWKLLKNLVYVTPIYSHKNLVHAKLMRVCGNYLTSLEIHANRRCKACVTVGERNFEKRL